MYKFNPKEEIPLETTVPEAPPSIIIPSDVSIYPPGGLYPNADPIVPSRSVPPILGSAHVPELQGYGDTGSSWPVYSSTLPVVPSFGSASHSEELIMRVLCPFDKIGRVIGKGGGTIKSIRQTSGARVEVDDTKADRDECIITVIATEVCYFSSCFVLYFLFNGHVLLNCYECSNNVENGPFNPISFSWLFYHFKGGCNEKWIIYFVVSWTQFS